METITLPILATKLINDPQIEIALAILRNKGFKLTLSIDNVGLSNISGFIPKESPTTEYPF